MTKFLNENEPAGVKSTFVLVHGAWHGGWCWDRVARILGAGGHRVYAPTLTGLGERSHLLSASVDLTTHIEDVVNVVRWNDLGQIVLVGHSYGGMVITGVAERMPDRIRSLVFVDAVVPRDGECLLDVLPPPPGVDGLAIPPFPAAFFNVNSADQAWVDSKLTPHPTASLTEKLRVTGAYRRIPTKVSIRAIGNGIPLPDQSSDEMSRDSNWILHEIESGHDIMVDKPNELALILEKIS
ncbi:alpha/beta fold hydrolase [Rhizorhabdus dicambivorans]|uniref:Alpha/beta hydrolase n=1 Tax=Rhizorhabdus dicambivorans TaxID=1850238 RepID=A0A2A4FMU2_9SPHN|nr:alpha/beta hydrolase [Rhizorhabdus dicambivorans]ATE65711.1 alpha/beta hydrolase [Rhizorhabdus dicambivorans]PCE40075.1 alpha/beta hydrolase [Rhizorhabdus dicambivorans]